MRTLTLDQLDGATIASALSAAYAGYFFPLVFSESATDTYFRVHDVVPSASPVWIDDGRPVAVAALGIRGDRAWVGAFGIAPEFRGKGLAQAMFGEVIRLAKRQHVRTMQLEVLEQNERARAIYERAGFSSRRTLLSLEGPADIDTTERSHRIEVGVAIAKEDAGRPAPCWQRETRTLRHRMPQLAALSCELSWAVYRSDGSEASIWRACLDGGRSGVLGGIARATGAQKLTVSNEPEGSPLLRALSERSWSQTALQHEMHLTL